MDVQTPVAGLRRVGRRNKNQSNPRTQSLVLQKLTELIKRPTVGPAPFGFAARLLIDPFPIAPAGRSPYPCQVFQGNSAVCGLCPRDNSFGDAVALAVRSTLIDPRLKTSLLARQPLQQFSASAPRTACAALKDLRNTRQNGTLSSATAFFLLQRPIASGRVYLCRPARGISTGVTSPRAAGS